MLLRDVHARVLLLWEVGTHAMNISRGNGDHDVLQSLNIARYAETHNHVAFLVLFDRGQKKLVELIAKGGELVGSELPGGVVHENIEQLLEPGEEGHSQICSSFDLQSYHHHDTITRINEFLEG